MEKINQYYQRQDLKTLDEKNPTSQVYYNQVNLFGLVKQRLAGLYPYWIRKLIWTCDCLFLVTTVGQTSLEVTSATRLKTSYSPSTEAASEGRTDSFSLNDSLSFDKLMQNLQRFTFKITFGKKKKNYRAEWCLYLLSLFVCFSNQRENDRF